MLTKSIVLVFLLGCHTSSPSVSSGSGSGETSAPVPAEPAAVTRPPQIAAADPSARPSPPAPAAPPPAAPAPKPDTRPAPAAPITAGSAAPGISETCGAGDACAAGLTCVRYYGFAGTRGPEFKTCEVRCQSDKVCPKGKTCMTVSDGPGQVCR